MCTLCCRRQEGRPVVAFTAKVASHLTSLGPQEKVPFASVVTNIGNTFNNATSVFTAPEDGAYVFFANIMSESGHGNEFIETEIVVIGNGVQLAEMYSGGSTFYDSTSNMAVATLKQGDKVWVRVHGSWSSNYAIHCCFSTFTGFMLGYIDNTDMVIG